MVCAISILCYRLTLEVIDAGQWVGHTHRVLREIHDKSTLDLIDDHETELLAAHYEKLTQSTEVTISSLAILGALATTLLCLSFYSTSLYIMERCRSEEETSRYAAELAIAKARLDAILASMGEECDRLIRLINDILDLCKIEVGKLSLFLKKRGLMK